MAANRRVKAAPSDEAARNELRRLQGVCNEATTQHLRRVAAQMNAEEGQRFLTLMQPKISQHDHAAPLGLQ